MRTASGFEVDFHARQIDGREELIQVCAIPDHPETPAREIGSLQEAAAAFPRADRVLIVLDLPLPGHA